METFSSEEMLFWLGKAEEWTSLELEKTRELSSHVKSLVQFLGRLNTWLESLGNVTTALKHQPKLGHLLGRLCSSQHLLCHDPEVYSTLLSCVQALRTESPHDGMERKAKNWAESQIRHTVSFYNQSNPGAEVAESVGYTAFEYNKLSTDQLILSIQRDLEYLLEQQQRFLTCLHPPSISLKEVSELCTPLLSEPSSKHLVECLILLHGQSSGDELCDLFLEKVTQTQASAYSTDCSKELPHWSLKYEALVSLWLRYLPALEQEVLLLLQAYATHLQHLGGHNSLKAIHSRDLPRACADHAVLYKAVDSCIQQVLWETKGCQHVLRFMHLFHVAVNEAVLQTASPQVTIHAPFEQRLCSLVNLLAVDPKVLPQEAHAIHLVSIHNSLMSTLADPVIANNPREMFTVWSVLVKFQPWYHTAVALLVRDGFDGESNAGVLSACLDLIAWFNWPSSYTRVNNVKEVVHCIAETLHKCMMGSVFSADKLKSALSLYLASPDTKKKTEFSAISTEFFMSALLQSSCVSPDDVLKTLDLLLNSTGDSSSSYTKLVLLLNYTDILRASLPAKVSGVGFDCGIPSHVTQPIGTLMDTLDRDVEEGGVIPHGTQGLEVLHKRCDNLTH